MTVLIIGTPDSGKSRIAEDMLMQLAGSMKKIYLATMIPYGEEGRARVEKHRKMREGKGFVTVEAPFDINDTFKRNMEETVTDSADAAVLLECLSNLAANVFFERGKSEEETVGMVTEDVKKLAAAAGSLVMVSNHFDDDGSFDDETRAYAKLMDKINERLEVISDKVIRI